MATCPGAAFPEAPEWTIGFGGKYLGVRQRLLYFGADAKYTAGYAPRFWRAAPRLHGLAHHRECPAGLQSRALGDHPPSPRTLLDERYLTVVDYDALPVYAQLGPSRSVGVNLRVKF